MASPAPSRPIPREPDRRKCRRPPTTPQSQVAHPSGELPDPSFLSPSRWFPPIRCHRAIIQLPDLGSDISSPPCLLRLLPAGANRRVGLAPTGKRRLITAHTHSGHRNDAPLLHDSGRRPGAVGHTISGWSAAKSRDNPPTRCSRSPESPAEDDPPEPAPPSLCGRKDCRKSVVAARRHPHLKRPLKRLDRVYP